MEDAEHLQSCAQWCWVARDLKKGTWAGVLLWAWAVGDVQLDNPQPSSPMWNCTGEMSDQEKGVLEIKSCSKALPATQGQMDEVVVALFLALPNFCLSLIAPSFYLFLLQHLCRWDSLKFLLEEGWLPSHQDAVVPRCFSCWDRMAADISWAFLVSTWWKFML